MRGAGKYDDECTRVRDATNADGVILIVIGGKDGQGFSVQASLHVLAHLPAILRNIADEIAKEIARDVGH